MTKLQTVIKDFFDDYARRSNDALQDPPKVDVDGVASAFASYFVGSSPKGVMGGANDDEFKEMVAQGFEQYRKVGGTEMAITTIKVTELDDVHAMASVDWVFRYKRPNDGKAGEVNFTNLYFLNLIAEPRIFAYVTPDEQQAMKDHGLI